MLRFKFLALLIFLTGTAFTAGAQKSYDLSLKLREGQSWRFQESYETEVWADHLPGGQAKTRVQFQTTRLVKKVYMDGGVDVLILIDSVLEDGKLEFFNAPPYSTLVNVPLIVKLSPRGDIRDIVPQDELPDEARNAFEKLKQDSLTQVPAPDKAVTVGERWQHNGVLSFDILNMEYDIFAKSESHFEGIDDYRDHLCAKVAYNRNMTGTIMQGKGGTFRSEETGTRMVDLETGQQLGENRRMRMNIKIPLPEGEADFSVEMTVDRALMHEDVVR